MAKEINKPNLLAGMLSKLAEIAPEKLYGAELLEDISVLGTVDVDGDGVKCETSSFGRLQVIVSGDGQKAYFAVKSEKSIDKKTKQEVWSQPESDSYSLVVRRVRNYGNKTKQWLVDNGIDPENFAPGQTVLHAVAE